MMQKTLLLTFTAIFFFFAGLMPAVALDARKIEPVRAKKVLDNADLEAIDAFVSQAVSEILNATDFSSVSNIRSLFLANSASNEPGQVQFDQQFSESAKKHIFAGLEKAGGLTGPERRFRVTINLLMLVDGLADPRLADIPLKYVSNNNPAVFYWAVHCVTSPEIVSKLNSSKTSDGARQIARRLEEIVPAANSDTLGLIASFAGSITIPDGLDLLLKVSDKRIASYADWSVKNELLDATILQLLTDKIASSDPGKAEAARRFCQLLSDIFQRYIKGGDRLSDSQKTQLISVLVETEKNCLPKLTGKASSGIKRALEASDMRALQQEHNNLLGDETKPGQLPTELNIDYGKAADGSPLKAPLILADPPLGEVSPSADPPKN